MAISCLRAWASRGPGATGNATAAKATARPRLAAPAPSPAPLGDLAPLQMAGLPTAMEMLCKHLPAGAQGTMRRKEVCCCSAHGFAQSILNPRLDSSTFYPPGLTRGSHVSHPRVCTWGIWVSNIPSAQVDGPGGSRAEPHTSHWWAPGWLPRDVPPPVKAERRGDCTFCGVCTDSSHRTHSRARGVLGSSFRAGEKHTISSGREKSCHHGGRTAPEGTRESVCASTAHLGHGYRQAPPSTERWLDLHLQKRWVGGLPLGKKARETRPLCLFPRGTPGRVQVELRRSSVDPWGSGPAAGVR